MRGIRLAHVLWLVALMIGETVRPCAAARILGLFPHPGASHFQFFQPILYALADAGHDVTVVSHFPDKRPPDNYKDIPLRGGTLLTNSVDLSNFAKRFSFGHFIEFFMLKAWGLEACELFLNSTAVEQVLNDDEPFDLILLEQFNSDCTASIAYKLQVPFIGLSSCALMPWQYDRIGLPHIPSYVPALFVGFSERMSFGERIANWITVHSFNIMYSLLTRPATNVLLRNRFGQGFPDIEEVVNRISLIFVNQHYSLSGPRPLPPSVVELGGIHIQEQKPIDADLKQILDTADHGVIYVSWGSMIRAETLPAEKRQAILQALGMFKQKVLWKWENSTLPDQPSNVYIRKWMPQKDILCNPKVRVFITHGGLLGSSEAAYCGVPVVVTPMYGDQFLNAAALVNRGMGNILHYEDITKDSVYAAIKMALERRSHENAKRVAYTYRNRQQSPKELAIWWIEHVIATGGTPLAKSYSGTLSWYAYHSIDVIAFLFTILGFCMVSWIWILKRVLCKKQNAPSPTITTAKKSQ